MAANKNGAFVRSKYYTPFWKAPLKWIPRSKSGASKSQLLWAAHTRICNVWEYPPPPGDRCSHTADDSRECRLVMTWYIIETRLLDIPFNSNCLRQVVG